MSDSFPKNFLWGSSTSAYQVEGGNFNNDWYEWESAGKTEPCGNACEHYTHFPEDFRLAKELGHNAHRLGLEWSRLEKEEGKWDEEEWDHYRKVLDELIKLEIEPVLTLNHFTVPTWLSKKGSWLNHDSAVYFSRFALKAITELSPRVKYWITINEPNILAILGYYTGEWPPQHKKDFREVVEVSKNMLLAHTSAYEKMKGYANSQNLTPMIGVAKAVTAFHPYSRLSLLDWASTFLRKKYYNHSFINSLIKGSMELPGLHGRKLSSKGTVDFIGLNYYFRQFIRRSKPFKENPFGDVASPANRKMGLITDMGWEVYPRGLYEVIKSFSRYRLPIMISENGIATREDEVRISYIKDHLKEMFKAISKGAPVIGYFHWSLLDNFEWAEGYSKKFGLVDVDFKTQERTVRPSGKYLKEVIEAGRV